MATSDDMRAFHKRILIQSSILSMVVGLIFGVLAAGLLRPVAVKPFVMPSEIRARAFAVVDENGEIRSTWGAARGGSVMGFLEGETLRLSLGLSGDDAKSATINLCDRKGKSRFVLSQMGEESAIRFYDSEGKLDLWVNQDEANGAKRTLFSLGKEGETGRVEIQQTGGGDGVILIRGADGEQIWDSQNQTKRRN